MPIETRFEGLNELPAHLAQKVMAVQEALYTKIFGLEIEVQSKIQGNLASGIGLKSRHGTAGLAGSVRANEPEVNGMEIRGEVQGAGGPFWYGQMWEFTGHKEIVPVTKRVLHWLADGKDVFAMRVSAQGPRPWFVPPFDEMKPYIVDQIKDAIAEATR